MPVTFTLTLTSDGTHAITDLAALVDTLDHHIGDHVHTLHIPPGHTLTGVALNLTPENPAPDTPAEPTTRTTAHRGPAGSTLHITTTAHTPDGPFIGIDLGDLHTDAATAAEHYVTALSNGDARVYDVTVDLIDPTGINLLPPARATTINGTVGNTNYDAHTRTDPVTETLIADLIDRDPR